MIVLRLLPCVHKVPLPASLFDFFVEFVDGLLSMFQAVIRVKECQRRGRRIEVGDTSGVGVQIESGFC